MMKVLCTVLHAVFLAFLYGGLMVATSAAMLGGCPPSVLLLLFAVLAVAIAAITMLY